jgi:hypothetical protein
MKRTTWLGLGAALLALWLGTALLGAAQDRSPAQRYECALIKWDGNDRVHVNLPDKSVTWRAYESGSKPPKEMPEEEFCLAWAVNKLAKEGWELVNLDSRRILLRRGVSR